MKQILQNISNGEIEYIELPKPSVAENDIIINTNVSLISSGTERMLLNFGKASYWEKARQQPEKFKEVLNKISTDGLLTTMDAVKYKLSQPLPLGYSNVGVITDVGRNVRGFSIGDRVVSNGPHAECVKVPQNLCALIPKNVDNESASFTVLASIGLQGIRLAEPTIGESFVVIGAGLIGLLTVQILIANGCKVLAIDLNDEQLELASQFGAITCNPSSVDTVTAGINFSKGDGVDGVIIAATTKSNDLISQAAQMSRKRGRIILVGVTGLELNRSDFYEKELTFKVSCSYGPGRYDPLYENKGQDYPLPFVRWTQKRNFEAILEMLNNDLINVKPLITHNFLFEDAKKAYKTLIHNKSLGIILNYKKSKQESVLQEVQLKKNNFNNKKSKIGFIGAGNYGSRVLIPAFKDAEAQLHTLITNGSYKSILQGKKFGFSKASTDVSEILTNQDINTVVIATRHDSHAHLVSKALESGKNVFVEKPLAINLSELKQVELSYKNFINTGNKVILMVGFNRRFSPHAQKMKALIDPIKAPKSFIITVNAGYIAPEHWTQDKKIGGGRIIGEACHFIDLMCYFANSKIISIQAHCMSNNNKTEKVEDNASITLGFMDGSFGTILYLSNGAKNFPKERVEIFVEGKILQLDNFKKLSGYGWNNFKKMNFWNQNKGQKDCIKAFLNSIRTNYSPISPEQIFEVTRTSIKVSEILRRQKR